MPDPNQQEDLTPLLIAGGLGASPFLGMIGERRLSKDPYYNKDVQRVTRTKLEQLAQPGDVVLGSRRHEGSLIYKHPQLGASGSEFYHAEPVVGRRGGRGRTIDAGRMDYSGKTPIGREGAEKLLRKGPGTYGVRMPTVDYEDLVLMRPKKKMSPAELKELQLALIEGGGRPYSKSMGVRALARDIFLPKIKGVTGHVGPLGSGMFCEGNMCSSLPAQAWTGTTGEAIAAGKHPKHVLPADFLRGRISLCPSSSDAQKPR